jgi:hypothetical protein
MGKLQQVVAHLALISCEYHGIGIFVSAKVVKEKERTKQKPVFLLYFTRYFVSLQFKQ